MKLWSILRNICGQEPFSQAFLINSGSFLATNVAAAFRIFSGRGCLYDAIVFRKGHMFKMIQCALVLKSNLVMCELRKCAEEDDEKAKTKKPKKEKAWGPILPYRKNERNVNDVRKIAEKAEELLKIRNLEKPAKIGKKASSRREYRSCRWR